MSKVNRVFSALVVLALVGVFQANAQFELKGSDSKRLQVPSKTFAIGVDWSGVPEPHYNDTALGTSFTLDIGGCAFKFETSKCEHYKKSDGSDGVHFKINGEDIYMHDKKFAILVSEITNRTIIHRVDPADLKLALPLAVPTYNCKPTFEELSNNGQFVGYVVDVELSGNVEDNVILKAVGDEYVAPSTSVTKPSITIPTILPPTPSTAQLTEESPDCETFSPLVISLLVVVGVLVFSNILSSIIGFLGYYCLQKKMQVPKDKSLHQKTEKTVGGTSTTVGKTVETQKTVGGKEGSAFNQEVPADISRPEIAAPTSAKK